MKIQTHDGDTEPAFGILDGGVLILDRHDAVFRVVVPDMYRIIDERRSNFWEERNGKFAFAEFFETYFSENLTNGAPREKFVVQSYFELFDREFPRDDLEIPKYYGDGLVSCPRCGRIFRPLSCLGAIRCNDPACGMEMNNPFYDTARSKESIEWKRLSHLAEYRTQYYCAKTERYHPAPPSRLKVFCERLSESFREWREKHRPRRGQEK